MENNLKNIISSKHNEKIKHLIRIRDNHKSRIEDGLFFVEGYRIIKDIDTSLIDSIYVSEKEIDLLNKISAYDKDNYYILSEDVFNYIKDTVTSQGIVALVRFDKSEINLNDNKFILILDDIKDPGNFGTIIRTAEAAGVDLVIYSSECVDPFSPKTIRACMSSIFRMKLYESKNLIADLLKLKTNNVKIVSTILESDTNYSDFDFSGKIAIIVGNEANGIKEDLIKLSTSKIKIDMSGSIESLNVSAATAIILFEAKKFKH